MTDSNELLSMKYDSAVASQSDRVRVNEYGQSNLKKHNCFLTSVCGFLNVKMEWLIKKLEGKRGCKRVGVNKFLTKGASNIEILDILKFIQTKMTDDREWKMVMCKTRAEAKEELKRQFIAAETSEGNEHRTLAIKRIITYFREKNSGHATVIKVYRKEKYICYTVIEYQENKDRSVYLLEHGIRNVTIFSDDSSYRRTTV